jgi:nucleoside diphosphate kinase
MISDLTYVLITPYTIQKSRTGGVIARLLSRSDLELVGAKMFAPTDEFIDEYTSLLEETSKIEDEGMYELFRDYIKESFAPHGKKFHRAMILLFKGEDACNKIYKIAGKIKPGIRTGKTVRDTYSDYIKNSDGTVKYFEPAIVVPSSPEGVKAELKIFAKYLAAQPNIIDKELLSGENDKEKRTLVIIKPDNWRYPSSRPGNIIDMLSKTGLRIVGCKLYRMSIEEALEFYGPVQGVLREKLAPKIGEQAKCILEKELDFKLNNGALDNLVEVVGRRYADDQFSMIVEFMAGIRPEECPKEEYSAPGKAKCFVLIYQGDEAVSKIRNVLGPTDPTKAPGGTVRRDFGKDVMVNTAHASDSFENAKREMRIVKIEKNDIVNVINVKA